MVIVPKEIDFKIGCEICKEDATHRSRITPEIVLKMEESHYYCGKCVLEIIDKMMKKVDKVW